ncbi:MAG TPA: hypothetical protein VFG43_01640 [Geminicoccaceae bacterium]|nr:hypothetical protein [Geminicoccaceae bacterium]
MATTRLDFREAFAAPPARLPFPPPSLLLAWMRALVASWRPSSQRRPAPLRSVLRALPLPLQRDLRPLDWDGRAWCHGERPGLGPEAGD